MAVPTSDVPRCRFCDEALVQTLVDLGHQPLANSYVDPAAAGEPEPRYPLHARVCHRCWLVQVDDVVPPDAIFSDYAYFSSYSSSWVEHARRFSVEAVERLGLDRDDLVVEIASNDGYLLQHFAEAGIPVLGVEPAQNVAEVAQAAGIPTLVEFFGRDLAQRIVAERGHADLVAANNVLAHVPDLNDFVAGLATLLGPDGVLAVEHPHLLRLLEFVAFDTIYHEHFSYLSLGTDSRVFEAHGLRVFDVEELSTHGGSIRVWACARDASRPMTDAVERVLRDEADAGLNEIAGYSDFTPKVEACRDSLRELLATTRANGQTVIAYGAAAKGNTLLNYCGVTADYIPFVVDKSPHKQGRLLPGSRIPIRAPEAIDEASPDLVLILPWNLRNEITAELGRIRTWGGRFVTAIPTVEVLT